MILCIIFFCYVILQWDFVVQIVYMICIFIFFYMFKKIVEIDKFFILGIKVDMILCVVCESVVVLFGLICVYIVFNCMVIFGLLIQDDSDEVVQWVCGYLYLMQQFFGIDEFFDGVVYYGWGYVNVFFNGLYFVFGEGDGEIFGDFIWVFDIIVYEMGYVIVLFGLKFVYFGEFGVMNEYLVDVFGVMVQQWVCNDQKDWCIGEEILVDGVLVVWYMLNLGIVYDNDVLGKDLQLGYMDQYKKIWVDNGGVYINLGIFNWVFVLFCEIIQELSWGRLLVMWCWVMEDFGLCFIFKQFVLVIWIYFGGFNLVVCEVWVGVGISI